ncbi:MAG: hypothetical protein H6747_12125 [Deltaproteobacteria bacterium]|nr:hypothetical protein [Deltaproteobacteria bacterium]
MQAGFAVAWSLPDEARLGLAKACGRLAGVNLWEHAKQFEAFERVEGRVVSSVRKKQV